jgi:hypothetical protein
LILIGWDGVWDPAPVWARNEKENEGPALAQAVRHEFPPQHLRFDSGSCEICGGCSVTGAIFDDIHYIVSILRALVILQRNEQMRWKISAPVPVFYLPVPKSDSVLTVLSRFHKSVVSKENIL